MIEQPPIGDRVGLERRLLTNLGKVSSNNGKSLLKGVSVFRSAPVNDWKVRLREFSQHCAGVLYELLTSEQANVIGVGWGATVGSVVTGIIALNKPIRSVPAWFIPTCGEPMGLELLDVSSSGLSRVLDETINGGYEHHLSLTGVLAVIPYDIQNEALVQEVQDRIVKRGRQYRDIFVELPSSFDERIVGQEPLINRLDAILTSLAPPKQPDRLYPEEQEASGINREELGRLVQYDLGGVNIPRSGLTVAEEEKVHFWNRRWTGISLEQYAACAQRSVAQQSPGVVVVAIGKNKAEAVHDAVARGLINNLLVDEELALAVDSLGVSDASR